MSAYIIVNLEITDPEKFQRYRELVSPLIQLYGGKYLVRGGKNEVLEGDWKPNRLVVLEFDSEAEAKKFWNSDDYKPVRQLRLESANSDIVMVEGT